MDEGGCLESTSRLSSLPGVRIPPPPFVVIFKKISQLPFLNPCLSSCKNYPILILCEYSNIMLFEEKTKDQEDRCFC